MKAKTNTKKDFERLHVYYQKRAYSVIIKDFRKMLKSIPYDNILEAPEAVIALNINDEALSKTMYKMYLDIGLKYGKHVVSDLSKEKSNKLNLELKDGVYPLFSEKFIRFITNYFKTDGGKKIVTLTQTMSKKVLRVISDASEKGLTQAKTIDLIKKTVNKSNFYRYNAMRIARTESLFAMNSAKVESFESSDFKVNKVWIQGGSKHPRIEHTMMDGVKVGSEDYFTLPNGERCMYPGDTSLSASQVVNCSCTIAYEPVRDNDGSLVYK